MYRIYLVEDDQVIAATIGEKLTAWGFTVRCAENFSDILGEFASFQPHLVLMDITLPFYNGYHWCQEIRRVSQVPILFLSSASDNINIVMAINMGADDFIAKPFDLSVLLAKVQAPSAGPTTTMGRATWWNTTAPCSTARPAPWSRRGKPQSSPRTKPASYRFFWSTSPT